MPALGASAAQLQPERRLSLHRDSCECARSRHDHLLCVFHDSGGARGHWGIGWFCGIGVSMCILENNCARKTRGAGDSHQRMRGNLLGLSEHGNTKGHNDDEANSDDD